MNEFDLSKQADRKHFFHMCLELIRKQNDINDVFII